jgi:hypothetical protein
MRTTVGPLSPAVYWRRRALVIGAVLVVVLLVTYSCGGSEEDGRQGATGNRPSASTDPNAKTQGPPGPPAVVPSAGEATGGPPVAGGGNGGAPGGGSPRPGAGGGDGTLCGDAEMAVVVTVDPGTVRQGAHATLTLKVKNVSNRTCNRDVGAEMQEIWIMEGETKQWSSDLCEQRNGEGMKPFTAGQELPFALDWNGRITSQGCDNRPYLAPGTYQVFARVGTKVSTNPATLVVTA